jgi:anti-anti-sigma regulatory factor
MFPAHRMKLLPRGIHDEAARRGQTRAMVEYEVSEKRGTRGYLRLRGTLVGEVPVEEFTRALERHYVDDGVKDIVVDLSDVTELSLEGVAHLLRLKGESRERGKRFHVQGVSGQPREKLEITGTLQVLTEE